MTEETLKFDCRGCGSSLVYSAGMQALKCQYCGTVTEIPREETDAVAKVADLIIPLAVERSELIDAVYQHLALGKYTPDNLLEHAVFSVSDRMYVPAYAFKGSFEAEWTATFGYDRTEHYTVFEKDSNGHTRPVTKSKTVTDWRPVNGTDSGDFAAVGYAGKLLRESPLELAALVEHCAGLQALTPFDSSYVGGIKVEEFVSGENETYKERVQSQVNEIIDSSVQEHAQGDRQRDWHWTARTSKTGNSVLIPICHAAYEYDGKTYHVWTDGTDVGRILADKLPEDEQRKKTVALGFAPVAASLSAMALTGMTSSGGMHVAVTSFTSSVVAAALAYGLWRRYAIINYSQQIRQSLLAQKKAASTNVAALSETARQELVNASKRPVKPWIADTLRDRVVLPVASAVVALGVISPSMLSRINIDRASELFASRPAVITAPDQPSSNDANPVPAPVVAETSAEVHEPEQEPRQDQEQAQPAAPTTQAPTESTSAVPALTPQPQPQPQQQQPQQQQQQARSTHPIVITLKAAIAGQWGSVDSQVDAIRQAATVPDRGDRKAARAANAEGLTLLNQQQYEPAIGAFRRGVTADGADIEILNNLGYALIQAGRGQEGIDVIAEVLRRIPDRSSAWANLAEAMAQVGNEGGSLASLKLAVYYSSNREKTLDYLGRSVDSHPLPAFRTTISTVLKEIETIPIRPR